MTINRKYIENNQTISDFIDYVLSFYGKGEIYDFGAKIDDVIIATVIYINRCLKNDNDLYTWGYGDSLDRERVRDILLDEIGYEWKATASITLNLT